MVYALDSDEYNVIIIIPHYNGEAILRRCLLSLKKTRYPHYSVLIVDNGSTDNSLSMVEREFPKVQILKSRVNRGYAGGCNYGISHSASDLIALLNNDAEVTESWLGSLVELMKENPDVAAVQPKVRSIDNRQKFDYCGAAGGEMDIFGYPFARGRLFHIMEKDTGQYDETRDIFWATGAAMILRREVLNAVGVFEESFFAHMEEIDLCWRFHLAGYRVCTAPQSVVYHQTGGTLGQEHLMKMVLNHRNNLLMILRNYSLLTLLWLFPMRLILELGTMIFGGVSGQYKRVLAVPIGLFGVIRQWKTVIRGRSDVKRIRKLKDTRVMRRMYHGSVAFLFFVMRKKRYRDLPGF
ncbi:glycosyltransferase family 2 protein [bacterium]|nr:glycosyltransferase family 2 protein [bacterium]